MPLIPEIVPAILTDTEVRLREMVELAARFAPRIQLDITDGCFVPSQSVGLEEMGRVKISTPWEVHLMVERPQEYLEPLALMGAKRVIFHYEATSSPAKLIREARLLGLEVGIALNPDTPIEVTGPFLGDIDLVLFLSVHPGFYGSPFIPGVLDKVRRFCKLWSGVAASVDGGVKEDNIAWVVAAGASEICIGSAIFNCADPEASYYRLMERARGACLRSGTKLTDKL